MPRCLTFALEFAQKKFDDSRSGAEILLIFILDTWTGNSTIFDIWWVLFPATKCATSLRLLA